MKISDNQKKVELVSRLVKDGHITFEEALQLLSEAEVSNRDYNDILRKWKEIESKPRVKDLNPLKQRLTWDNGADKFGITCKS